MADFIRAIVPPGTEVLTSDRKVIGPKELDVYLPSLALAFEFNGDYWHSKKPAGYHEAKTQACADLGITLLHVAESAWVSGRVFVEQEIRSLIGAAAS